MRTKARSTSILSPLTRTKVTATRDLGSHIRTFRKSQQLTLEKVSGLCNLGMRFLSELERGKETAEIGKVLSLLNKLGLEVIIQPRGYDSQAVRHSPPPHHRDTNIDA